MLTFNKDNFLAAFRMAMMQEKPERLEDITQVINKAFDILEEAAADPAYTLEVAEAPEETPAPEAPDQPGGEDKRVTVYPFMSELITKEIESGKADRTYRELFLTVNSHFGAKLKDLRVVDDQEYDVTKPLIWKILDKKRTSEVIRLNWNTHDYALVYTSIAGWVIFRTTKIENV